jgi:hypothetical protein
LRIRIAIAGVILLGIVVQDVEAQSVVTPARGVSAVVTLFGQRDSNLFRLPDGVLPPDVGIEGNRRGETTISPGLTIEAFYPFARQDFFARVGFYWNRFTEYSAYDTNSVTYRLGWTWRTAEELSGELAAARDQSNTAFQDFLGPTRNVLTVYSERASVSWQPRPDRRLSASLDYLDGSNSTVARSLNDFKVANLTFRAAAVSPLGNELYLSYVGTNGEYPNRLISELLAIDNSYRQDNFNLGLIWNTPRTRVEARGGYVSRKYEAIAARDFARPVWLLNATWAASGKTALGLSYVRDLTSIEDLDRAYTISTTATATVRYSITPQVAVSAQYFRQDVDWAGDPLTAVSEFLQSSAPARQDRYTTPRLVLEWRPALRWSISVSQEWPSRTSNRNGLQYDASVSTVVLQYSIGP